ncbi:MAG: DUF362 domain-containing protein [Candidatus Latescibacterota bacterium]
MHRMIRKHLKLLAGALLLASFVLLDVGYTRLATDSNGKWAPVSSFPGTVKQQKAKIAIVRADDAALPNPTSLEDPNIDDKQIEAMVRRAVDLMGGFKGRFGAGDLVLIKPNIVEPQASGVGETTDTRVVKALIRVVNDIAPGKIDIVVGEGSANPMDYEMPYNTYYKASGWKGKLWDVGGFQDLLTDPDLQGIPFRLENLNGPWDDLVFRKVPGGAYQKGNEEGVWIHKIVAEADFHITVPVMKIHSPMTVALKNNIGLYPSMRYGYYKAMGVPQDGRKFKIHPADPPLNWMEEAIVDIARLSGVDFVVVDAVMCLEKQKGALIQKGKVLNQVRRNMILAGEDMVAMDTVAAQLMGLNPDDVSHITLAEMAGLGTNDPAKIEVVGSTIGASAKRFRRSAWQRFGQSCRTWTIRGTFDASGEEKPLEKEFLPGETNLRPIAGQDGWSEPLYCFDDRIDLNAYFKETDEKSVAYLFSYFDAPKSRKAELWVGSDEALRIYLNGKVVYNYTKERDFNDRDVVSDKVSIALRAGENTLLVKAFHSRNRFDFLLNICEPEKNPDFDGNRVAGLKFRTER